tara:strand:+ start:163 stop:438 length:276 start_codon:yes stop_codon:yes gene_type:complete
MKIKAIKCLNCNDIVYSRAQDDFRECSCRQVYVDGGFSFFKNGALPGAEFKTITVDVSVSLGVLYEDWSSMKDKYGIIKESNKDERAMYKV